MVARFRDMGGRQEEGYRDKRTREGGGGEGVDRYLRKAQVEIWIKRISSSVLYLALCLNLLYTVM